MRIGIIFVGWQCEDLLPMSLTPWIDARRANLGGHDYVVCAVSVPFIGFPQDSARDNTHQQLDIHLGERNIDNAIIGLNPMKETDARGQALKWLVAQNVDILWQVDVDEVYTEQDILGILGFVQANPFIAYHCICLRNAVFTKEQYLVEPFTPPRIHKVNLNRFRAADFWDDNNVLYRATDDGAEIRDTKWASFTIPPQLAFIYHETWLSNERSRKKVEYQRARWGHCSFKWEPEVGLSFDESYFSRLGQPLPEVARL